MKIYKEIPEQFHNQFCDTLEQLDDRKTVRFTGVRYAAACIALLLVTSTVTVGAVEFWGWYRAASERFATDKELENKLTDQGVAIPAEDFDEDGDMTLTALQAIKNDKDFYLLAALEWPEELEWNGDIMFADSQLISEQEFRGFTVNFAEEPDENGIVYVEIDLLGEPGREYSGEVVVVLRNLIQTAKSAYKDTLREAEWALTFELPQKEVIRSFQTAQIFCVNGYELDVEKVEINPFSAKLYMEEELARQATECSDICLSAVVYEDGSIVEEYGYEMNLFWAKDEEGNFYFDLLLETAVDVDQVCGLVFQEGDQEILLALSPMDNILAE